MALDLNIQIILPVSFVKKQDYRQRLSENNEFLR